MQTSSWKRQVSSPLHWNKHEKMTKRFACFYCLYVSILLESNHWNLGVITFNLPSNKHTSQNFEIVSWINYFEATKKEAWHSYSFSIKWRAINLNPFMLITELLMSIESSEVEEGFHTELDNKLAVTVMRQDNFSFTFFFWRRKIQVN